MLDADTDLDEFFAELERNELDELQRQKDELIEEHGILFYEPHWKQHLFHIHGHIRWRYGRWGNRGGKSECGTLEDCAFALGERPWYKQAFDVIDGERRVRYQHPGGEDHPFVTKGIPQRPTKGVIICQDWDKAEEIFTNTAGGEKRGKLMRYLPKESIVKISKGGRGQIDGLEVKSRWGGTSLIMLESVTSFLQNAMGHESSAWDWVHADEPIPEAMFEAYVRGLSDSCGPFWTLCTQLDQPWLNDFFIPDIRFEPPSEGKTFFDEALDDEKFVIFGSSYDNPHVNKKGLKALEVLATKSGTVESRIKGGSSLAGRLIYSDFNPGEHVYHEPPVGWENVYTPPQDYCVRYSIDHHPSANNPDAVLFLATAPTGEVYAYNELFLPVLTPALCEEILNVIGGRKVANGLIDPISFIENPNDGSRTVDYFHMNGVMPGPGQKNPLLGIRKVQELLKQRTVTGDRLIKFGSHLKRTAYEFDRYVWSKKNPDKPDNANKMHMMEALYRMVIERLHYVEPDADTVTYVNEAYSLGAIEKSLNLSIGHPNLLTTGFGL